MSEEKPLTIGDWMTENPVTIRSKQTIGEALRLMFERDVRHLPVVGQGGLIGVVSDRDIRQLLGKVRTAVEDPAREGGYLRLSVSEVMSAPPVKVKSSTAIREAVQIMIDHKFGSLPVVDLDNTVIGIFTEFDALKYCLYLIDRYQEVY